MQPFSFHLLSCLCSGTAGTMLIVRTSRGTSAQKGFAMEEASSGDLAMEEAELMGLNAMWSNIHAIIKQ